MSLGASDVALPGFLDEPLSGIWCGGGFDRAEIVKAKFVLDTEILSWTNDRRARTYCAPYIGELANES